MSRGLFGADPRNRTSTLVLCSAVAITPQHSILSTPVEPRKGLQNWSVQRESNPTLHSLEGWRLTSSLEAYLIIEMRLCPTRRIYQCFNFYIICNIIRIILLIFHRVNTLFAIVSSVPFAPTIVGIAWATFHLLFFFYKIGAGYESGSESNLWSEPRRLLLLQPALLL